MKRKIITLTLAALLTFTTACGFEVGKSVEKSDTGVIAESIVNNKITLNHVTHEFPKDCTIQTAKLTKPVGISVAQISQNDAVVGVLADGFYLENITKENIIEATNVVLKEITNMEGDITVLSEDAIIETSHLNIVYINFTDGIGCFIAKPNTPDFVYLTQVNSDNENVMGDTLKNVVKTFGGEEDLKLFEEESETAFEENEETNTSIIETTPETETETETGLFYVRFSEGDYPIAIPNTWTTDQYDYSFYTHTENIDICYRDSATKINDETELTTYYESLKSVYEGINAGTVTVPCQDGSTVEAYVFTVPKDGYTKTKILEPIKINDTFLSTYLEIEITDYSGSIDFTQLDAEVFNEYVGHFLCAL